MFFYNWKRKPAILYLEDGTCFKGKSIGQQGTTGGEICFNTGMTGYQEIYTDPSYHGQIIINTCAHIGNYGILDSENQSLKPHIKGLVVKSFSHAYSRANSDDNLESFLKHNGIVGISEIDTRALVIYIRNKGAMNALISTEYFSPETLVQKIQEVPQMKNLELASQITTTSTYFEGSEQSSNRIAVLDLGVKKSILQNLTQKNCYCQVFPAKTSFEVMEHWKPDGYMISNGPGDPGTMAYAVETVKAILKANKPLFGICLGLQIIAKACGIETYKMHHGHRGINHPVKNLQTNLCEITSQNHGFGVVEDQVKKHPHLEITHINLNDKTIEGFRLKNKKAFCVQYHPEASPGPNDSEYLFEDFTNLIN